MKILSFHPFSLYVNGGGSRVLRRLYDGHEAQVSCLVVSGELTKCPPGIIKETLVSAFPTLSWWMRWRLRDYARWVREKLLLRWTTNRIRRAADAIPHDVIHVINHGPFSLALCDYPPLAKKPMWVSFHDHFSTTGSSFNATKELWKRADRRLVISAELGDEYQKLFGIKDFELITDGVSAEEISLPNIQTESPIIIYFTGLLHIEYLPLFSVLADALDLLSEQGFSFRLILRGTQDVDFLNNRSFTTEYRHDFISDDEVKRELDRASILYLPIKFVIPDFYLYSLSTKMVSYLGGSGSILYHGPANSAACQLLQHAGAAACCTSLNVEDLKSTILHLLNEEKEISINSKKLAYLQFNLAKIRKHFWQESYA